MTTKHFFLTVLGPASACTCRWSIFYSRNIVILQMFFTWRIFPIINRTGNYIINFAHSTVINSIPHFTFMLLQVSFHSRFVNKTLSTNRTFMILQFRKTLTTSVIKNIKTFLIITDRMINYTYNNIMRDGLGALKWVWTLKILTHKEIPSINLCYAILALWLVVQ